MMPIKAPPETEPPANRAKEELSRLAPDLRRIGVFVTFIAFIAIFLHLSITAGLRRIDTSRFGVWNAIVDGTINTDILIAGSSRALTHYDPRIIQQKTGLRAYNIGLNGAQTDMQLARIKTYLRHNKPPLVLLFNLDVFTFQLTHGGVFDPAQYMPYLNEPDLYQALRSIDPEIWKSRFFPLYGYTVQDLRFQWILGIASLLRWKPVETHYLGFEPRFTPWTGEFENLLKANPDGVHFEVEPAGIELVEELLKLCRNQGIRVILVYSPEYKEFQKVTRNRTEVFKLFAQLSRDYSTQLWDYSDSAVSADKELFYNSQHLNARGAEKFTLEIADRLASDPQIAAMAANPRPGAKSSP